MPPGGIQTHNLSRQAATDPHFRPRGHWDRRPWVLGTSIYKGVILERWGRFIWTSPSPTFSPQCYLPFFNSVAKNFLGTKNIREHFPTLPHLQVMDMYKTLRGKQHRIVLTPYLLICSKVCMHFCWGIHIFSIYTMENNQRKYFCICSTVPVIRHPWDQTRARLSDNTVIPRLTKIIHSGITFVSRNVISRRFL